MSIHFQHLQPQQDLAAQPSQHLQHLQVSIRLLQRDSERRNKDFLNSYETVKSHFMIRFI